MCGTETEASPRLYIQVSLRRAQAAIPQGWRYGFGSRVDPLVRAIRPSRRDGPGSLPAAPLRVETELASVSASLLYDPFSQPGKLAVLVLRMAIQVSRPVGDQQVDQDGGPVEEQDADEPDPFIPLCCCQQRTDPGDQVEKHGGKRADNRRDAEVIGVGTLSFGKSGSAIW